MELLFHGGKCCSSGHYLSSGEHAVCEEANKNQLMKSAAVAASYARRTASRGMLCALLIALAGCATIENYAPLIRQMGVYKLDINQGNFISQDMVDKLKNGMTRQQVRLVLGTPLVTSAFRDNRWDYVYEYQRDGRVREHRQFTVYFKDDVLARWEGDEMPASVADLNRAAAARALPEGPQDSGVMGKIIDFFKKL